MGGPSNEELQEQIRELASQYEELAAKSFPRVFEKEMTNLAAMLEPIRSLRPKRTPLEPNETAALEAIHKTLKRPEYSNLEGRVLDEFGKSNKAKDERKKS